MRIDDMNRRILIIDDNETLHQDYRKILGIQRSDEELDDLSLGTFGEAETAGDTLQSGCKLDSTFQGHDAYKLVQESGANGKSYAMVCIDVRLPPGWDVIETIENLWKADPDLNIVICSALSDELQEKNESREKHVSNRMEVVTSSRADSDATPWKFLNRGFSRPSDCCWKDHSLLSLDRCTTVPSANANSADNEMTVVNRGTTRGSGFCFRTKGRRLGKTLGDISSAEQRTLFKHY